MNRILRRPMFRRGGSTNEGITSGLDTPRVNYQSGMNFDMAKILQDTSKQVQDPAIRSAYQPYFQRPQGEGLNRFLMDFGLNLMSTPPRGGFLSTAATAARGPLKTLNEDMKELEKLYLAVCEMEYFPMEFQITGYLRKTNNSEKTTLIAQSFKILYIQGCGEQ